MASLAETLVTGTMKSISENTPDLGKALIQGAQLAQKQQEIETQRQQIEVAKKQAQDAKLMKFAQAFQTGAKIESPKSQNEYFKNFLPKLRDGMGLQEVFPDDAIRFASSSPENLSRFGKLLGMLGSGDITMPQAIDAFQDPSKYAQIFPGEEHVQIEPEPLTQEQLTQLAQAQRSQVAAQAQAQRFQTTQDIKATQRFTDYTKQLNQKVTQAFKPVEDSKLAIRNAYDSLIKVQNDISTGKKPSSIDFNSASRGLAKAFNSGAMSDKDVGDFRNLTGIDNITIDTINKWFTGDVNPKSVKALLNIATRSARNLDKKSNSLVDSFSTQFSTPEFAGQEEAIRRQSGIDAYAQPTLSITGKFDQLTKDYPRLTLRGFESLSPAAQAATATKYGLTVNQIKQQLGAQ